MKPFQIEKLTLHHSDCFPFMRKQAANHYDLILTSPPYNMNLRLNGAGTGLRPRNEKNHASNKYSDFTDSLTMAEYEKFLKNTFRGCLRIADVSFINLQMVTGNKSALFRAMGSFADKIKEFVIWDKGTAAPASSPGVLNSRFEFFVVLSDSAIKRAFKPAYFDHGTLDNVFSVKREASKDATHGAVFPRALAKLVIENFSPEGGRVFDPFTGTGTTAIACHETGRHFTGTERDAHYYGTACERMMNETSQQDLFI